MVKNTVKRKISGEKDSSTRAKIKKARKKMNGSESVEDFVKEFLKLTTVKKTRMEGLIQFLTAIKIAEDRHEIILKYLQTHPDCSEMFEVLSEDQEKRQLFEVQTVLEILEIIVLQLAEDDMKTKSQGTVIVSRLLTNHRRLVYSYLNSSSPASVTMAVLKLLTAIVMHGPTLARELFTAFDFSHKTFCGLVSRRDNKDVIDVRTCFIKFVLSFFVTGDPSLIQQVLQIKGFATSILKNLYKDSAEVINLTLSTLLVKIVQSSSILKKTKILLFTSYSLSQLARLYSYQETNVSDTSVRRRIHHFLLQLCTSRNGIAFENKMGIFSAGSNNPVLLRFLHSLPKTLNDDLLIELIIRTLQNSQDLISPYLSGYQMTLEPRNSEQWLNNFIFLIKLYFHLPVPSSIFRSSGIFPNNISDSQILSVVCPDNVKRNILARGLQHPDAVVQGTTLTMMLVILRRSCNLMQTGNVDDKMLTSFLESVLKLLPSFQVLISIRENLSKRIGKETMGSEGNVDKDISSQLTMKDVKILLSRTLACMSLFEVLSPNYFIRSNYDPWKLLPRNALEETLYNSSSKHSMLTIFLNCPSRYFKWHLQTKTDNSVYFHKVLKLYFHEKETDIHNMAKELLQKFLLETGACNDNKDEVSIWLNSLFNDCLNDREVLIKFFEKVYSRLASDPFDFVDDVIESVHAISLTSPSHLAVLKNEDKRSMPFTPVVPCALKLFAHVVKDSKMDTLESLEIVALYLNLVLLDILELQTDPRPLCNMIVKILTQDDLTSLPVHTRLLLDYVIHWSDEVNVRHLGITGDDERRFLKIFKHFQKKETVNKILCLPLRQVKKQINSSIHSGEPLDLPFVVNYLSFNPVFLFDSDNCAELGKTLSGLPCSLIVRQLLMFVLKYWQSGTVISDSGAIWDIFKALVDDVLVTAERENVESWERTVSAILHLSTSVVICYLKSSRNKHVFLEVQRTVIEVLGIAFAKVRKMSASCSKIDLGHVGGDATDDVAHNDVIQEDVVSVIDETCGKCQYKVKEEGEMLQRFIKMVFEHDVFKNLFYCHVGLMMENDNHDLYYVSRIMTDCVAELMKCHWEILQDTYRGYLEPYLLRIIQAMNEQAFGNQSIDIKLPYNVPVTVLFKLFIKNVPVQMLNEIFQVYLAIPKEQFIEMQDSNEDKMTLSRNGETLIQIAECIVARDEIYCDDPMSLKVWDGLLHLLLSINCQKCDEIIAKVITKFSGLSDHVLSAVLQHSLNKATSVCVETALLVLCEKPALLSQLEEWMLTYIDGKGQKKNASCKEEKSLEFEWETFLPLLLFYLCTVSSDQNAALSEQSEKCLKYLQEITWKKIGGWLLEMKYMDKSKGCLKILLLLLQVNSDSNFLQNLFTRAVVRERFLKLNLYQIEAVEYILQCILKRSLKEKDQKKYRTIFVFTCMARLTGVMKNQRDDESLKPRLLNFLKEYGEGSLKFKKIETISPEDFVNITNSFLKTALKFYFTCSQTLRVLSILVKTIYETNFFSSLLPLTDLYQFILNHSKFLKVFLGNTNSSITVDHKEALVDLLQAVVDLEPKCCEPSHLFLILGAYSAKRRLVDQKLLRLLFTYETNLDNLALGSHVLWGEAAIEAYEAGKNGPKSLWHETNITHILDLLNSKLLLQSAKHFPQERQLQPLDCEDFGPDSQFYDPSFLLPLFSFFLAPGCEVNCRRFIESSALAYTIAALTSVHKEVRQVAYQILSRFQSHLSTARFREKQQVSHLLHFFQNGITEADCRISSLITSFMARALHIFFYPEDPLYPSVNSYMLQKAFMDLRDVPLFLSLLNNSDLVYRAERTWLLHVILDGLRDSMDYYICKKYHVFQQLFTLLNSAVADKSLQNLILKIVHEVCRHHAAVFDLCHNYGLVPWFHLLLTANSNISENIRQILDILTTIWFTLIGQNKSRDEQTGTNGDVASTRRPHLPKNISSELLLVLSSVLQSRISLDSWNEEMFLTFARLLASLVNYQHLWLTTAKIILTKQQLIKIVQIWRHFFGSIDIYSKLQVLVKLSLSTSENKLTSEKWFRSVNNVMEILRTSDVMECTIDSEGRLQMYLNLSRLGCGYFDSFLQRKLRSAVKTFMTISHSTLLPNDGLKLSFLSAVVCQENW